MKYDINSIAQRKKRAKRIKTILDILLVILIYHMLLVFVSCLNKIGDINIFGFSAYSITTKSMEPEIKLGEVVIVKQVSQNELQVGDIITFERNRENITHRIVEVQEQGYITKGDNNNTQDEKLVYIPEIKGKCVMTIPFLGKVIGLLNNQLVFLIVVLVILIIVFFKLGIEEKKEIRRNKKSEADKKGEY